MDKYLNIKIHIRSKHGVFVQNPLCSYCKKHFIDGPQLKQHILQVHKSNAFLCDLCGKPFSSKQNLRRHGVKWHNKPGNFTCHVCDHKTYDRVHLEKHMNKHRTRDKVYRKFLCHQCGRGFRHQRALDKHLGGCLQSIVCHVCAATFTSLHIYKEHVRGKHGAKQYKCQHCGKTFRWRSSLSDHNSLRCVIQNVKPARPYKCLDCNKRFKWFSSLRSHHTNACPVKTAGNVESPVVLIATTESDGFPG